jgi:hypothetical protein
MLIVFMAIAAFVVIVFSFVCGIVLINAAFRLIMEV